MSMLRNLLNRTLTASEHAARHGTRSQGNEYLLDHLKTMVHTTIRYT